MSLQQSSDDITSKLFQTLIAISLPPQIVIEDGAQKKIDGLTWNDVFSHIKSQHWHKTGKYICPHAESLYDHLQTCGNLCYTKAQKEDYSSQECIKAYLTGLLHDIGKPGTMRLAGKFTAFKGHGLVGGAMLENFYTSELGDAFGLTNEDWADISTCADVHMCSYFPMQTSALHKFSVNILPASIKKMLFILRTGDNLALVPDACYPKTIEEIRDQVESGEEVYRNTLFSEMDFSEINKKKGVLIMLQGGSSSGKSTFAQKLMTLIGQEKCTYCARDWYMVHEILKSIGERTNITDEDISPELFQQCYKIYIDSERYISPVLYQLCYKMYIDSGKKCAPQINKHMCDDIFTGLQRGNVVIVDTMATMFDSIETIIPEVAKNAYRVSFWLHRNQLITEEETKGRLGMDMKSQIGAHGTMTIYNPFNSTLNWSKTISGSEKDNGENDNYLQSHLSISVGWTGIKNKIIAHLCEKFTEIYAYNQRIPRVPVIDQTMDMSLLELVQKLKDVNGIEEFFGQYNYSLSRYIPGAIGIKYVEGINQIWKPKWSREARGRFYYIGGEKVVPLKNTLMRGIEVLTISHLDGGITETQDINSNSLDKLDKLDSTQQMIMRTFSSANEFDSYITGKVDGSLLIVNVYPKECEQYSIIKELALTHGDAFTQTLVKYCADEPIITISTQGTLFIGGDMQDYFLTAIQSLIEGKDWEEIIPKFTSLILDYYASMKVGNTEMVNLCFEAYCKDRTTITGKLHTELAVGYNHSGLNLLGAMNQNRYLPHFLLPRRIFKQPFFYNIKNTMDVFRFMNELDKVVLGKRSVEEFLKNFVQDEFTSLAIHPEGFVLLTPSGDSFDYAKIKTQMYYKCHKVKETNIQELLKLPVTCGTHYPILNNLHSFFDNLSENINDFVIRIFGALTTQINKDSVFYKKQNPKARLRMDVVIDVGVDKADSKAVDVLYKMMLNNRDNWSDAVALFKPITLDIYKADSEEMMLFTKSLIMKVEPWNVDWKSRLDKLFASFDEAVNSLYGIVVGFTH